MSDHEAYDTPPHGSFWRSRAGLVLIGFLAVGGLLLAYEHRVHLLTSNGLLIVLLALCVGMHLFMHSGHRGHSGHARHDAEDESRRHGGQP